MNSPWPRALRQVLPALAAFGTLWMSLAPVHAAMVITAATQFVSADTTLSDTDVQTAHLISGAIDANVLSVQPGVRLPARASAGIDVLMDADLITGSGQVQLSLGNDASGLADSFLEVFFNLTRDMIVTGSAALSGSGEAASHAFFNLDRVGVGGGSILAESDTAPQPDFEGELLAGDYRLRLHATSVSQGPNESGLASFNFSLRLHEVDAQAVPEPQGWLLALAGLAACATLRRKSLARR